MNHCILITGGGHGIGKQICLDFLEAGDQVCFMDSEQKDSFAFAKTNERLSFFHGDVSKPEKLKEFVSFGLHTMGKIDILVNNACQSSKGIRSNLSYEELDYILAIGLKAPYELARLCKEELLANKGRIINIASSRAFQSEPDSEAYASAKGGLVALTHALAISLGPKVLVNAIAPGWIEVNGHKSYSKEELSAIPAGKVGTTKDISQLVLFLCEQTFMTGETITVDGGMNKRMIYHGDWNWQYQEPEDKQFTFLKPKDFDLKKIADSGQCFRWKELEDGSYRIVAKDKWVIIGPKADSNELQITCTKEEFVNIWEPYFDLATDYSRIRKKIPKKDQYLYQAAEYGKGIRILKQDPWEMLITFLLSQRKSIPGIKTAVEKLCKAAGKKIGEEYAFPTPEQILALSEKQLSDCGLGYRTKYVSAAARTFASNQIDMGELRKMNDETLHDYLCSLLGVGTKVANCVMLFGFYRLNAFPIDTWINRVLEQHYPKGFDEKKYAPYNGLMQQYLFYFGKKKE